MHSFSLPSPLSGHRISLLFCAVPVCRHIDDFYRHHQSTQVERVSVQFTIKAKRKMGEMPRKYASEKRGREANDEKERGRNYPSFQFRPQDRARAHFRPAEATFHCFLGADPKERSL